MNIVEKLESQSCGELPCDECNAQRMEAAALLRQAANIITARPSLLCRIIGHKWEQRLVDEGESNEYATITTVYKRTCRRCGAPNPLYFNH